MKDEEKIEKLKKELSDRNPVIILGGINQYQHYITILGYNKNIFFIYDSLQKKDPYNQINLTIDKNGTLPGNINMSEKELLSFWRKGGKYNLFRWYALIAKKY